MATTLVSTEMGIELCRKLHTVLEPFGFFPALTGGLLYKDGPRKDIDIVVYRHRQKVEHFETEDIKLMLSLIGVEIVSTHGFVTKAKWKGVDVDIFNPETDTNGGSYGNA